MPQRYQGNNAAFDATLTLKARPTVNVSQAGIIAITKDGTPITATNVYCDVQMPGMTMGSNRPIAENNADGTYMCGLLFTMSGEWAVIVHGTYQGTDFAVTIPDIVVSE
ncbi:MAG: FixH family protein [Roseiflexaceae bacterium]